MDCKIFSQTYKFMLQFILKYDILNEKSMGVRGTARAADISAAIARGIRPYQPGK